VGILTYFYGYEVNVTLLQAVKL